MAEGNSWLEQQLDFKIVKLSHPIRADGKEVHELRIREPVARDLRVGKRHSEDEDSKFQAILATVTGLPLSAIGMLRIADYQKCAEALAALGFTATPDDSPGSGSDGPQQTGSPH